MPIISIKMAKGRTEGKKQELVASLTAEAVRILEVEPAWVTLNVKPEGLQPPPENYLFMRSTADMKKRACRASEQIGLDKVKAPRGRTLLHVI